MKELLVIPPMSWVEILSLCLIGLGMVFCLFRLWRGPSLLDRVVALDLMAIHLIGLFAWVTLVSENKVFLNGAFILGLVAFLGTVAYARYLERGVK